MLQSGARVLDLDGSVTAQIGRGLPPPEIVVDLRAIGREARLWANAAQREQLRATLRAEDRHRPTFIGSGDYHFVSAILIEQFTEPISVIVFDHHPDWERLPPRYGCGAWVNRALDRPNVQRVLHIGADSTDLDFPARLTGNRAAARSGRLQLLPWAAMATDPLGAFRRALAALPAGKVYVSIDKDCLGAAHALTNWEEGNLELATLLECLREIALTRDIVGLDIVGDYSPPSFRSALKAWCARWDHPAEYTARGRDADAIAHLNAATNARILAELS